jgi:hypothetical protein
LQHPVVQDFSTDNNYSINNSGVNSSQHSNTRRNSLVIANVARPNCNINMSKVANIKHFNSTSNTSNNGSLPLPVQQQQELNSNDLYAILKPVIKPICFDQTLDTNRYLKQSNSLSFNLVYLGSVMIPYDTLSNASKLTSIRNSVEFFLDHHKHFYNYSSKSTSLSSLSLQLQEDIRMLCSSPTSVVTMKISGDSVKLRSHVLSVAKLNELLMTGAAAKPTNTIRKISLPSVMSEKRSNSNSRINIPNNVPLITFFSKTDIAFCGRIKDDINIFGLVILNKQKENNNKSNFIQSNRNLKRKKKSFYSFLN